MTSVFSDSLRPPHKKPSSKINQHKIDFKGMVSLAKRMTSYRQVTDGDKPYDLYLNPEITLSDHDLQRLEHEIGRNHPEDSETRSSWMDIEPVRHPHQRPTVTVQLKGVVFNANHGVREYSGNGWIPEIFFAHESGEISRREIDTFGALGRCAVIEAVCEYLMCQVCAATFPDGEVLVPAPLGWGVYTNGGEETPYGFVLLGLPELQPGREAAFHSAVETYRRTQSLRPLIDLFKARSRVMSQLHRRGLLIPGRHFGNFSLTPDNNLFVHDLGAITSFVRPHLLNEQQYAAEAFCQLIYAFTPRKVCIPVPPEGHPARQVLMDHFDTLLSESLPEYYLHEGASRFTLADLQDAFFDALLIPVHESSTPLARFHTERLQAWSPSINAWPLQGVVAEYIQETCVHA